MQDLSTIDWANVNWLYVAELAVLVFFSTLTGMLLSFKRAFGTALLSALLFAGAFVFWNYYPHGLPLPTMMTTKNALGTDADRNALTTPAQPDRTINRPPGNSQ